MLLTQTSQIDYEEVCRLDVLGLVDKPQHDQGKVYREFREHLTRSEEGWYEVSLPWKGNHPPLPSNEQGSLRRLENLKRKLQRMGMEEAYNAIIEEQKREPCVVAELRKSIYVDDLISGGATVVDATQLKDRAVEVFEDATFALHGWQSNEPFQDENLPMPKSGEETFAKQQIGQSQPGGSSLLGLGWDKTLDEIIISFPEWEADPTKWGVPRKLASIYDPGSLGLFHR